MDQELRLSTGINSQSALLLKGSRKTKAIEKQKPKSAKMGEGFSGTYLIEKMLNRRLNIRRVEVM
jgi:hypothetical protein